VKRFWKRSKDSDDAELPTTSVLSLAKDLEKSEVREVPPEAALATQENDVLAELSDAFAVLETDDDDASGHVSGHPWADEPATPIEDEAGADSADEPDPADGDSGFAIESDDPADEQPDHQVDANGDHADHGVEAVDDDADEQVDASGGQADDGADPAPDEAVQSAPSDEIDPLLPSGASVVDESTDDDDITAPTGAARTTIVIGGDVPGGGDVPPVTSRAGDDAPADDAPADGVGPTTISIGADDDLPDAVYLDDDLSDVSGSGPVFIDDDGTGDAIAAKDATGPGIEPRLRQRRIGVRRAAGRRRLKWAIGVGAVVVVAVGVLAVLGSSLFSVDDVDVTGVQRADADVINEIIEDIQGEPVLLVDTSAIEERLEAIPYVEAARVTTDFPSSASIEIREREPVATGRGVDGLFRILDRDGRVIDVIEGQPIEFAQINGFVPLDTDAGDFADPGYSAAAALVTKLTPEIRGRLISMSVVPDGSDLRLFLSNGEGPDIEVRMGDAVSDNDQIERLVRLQRRLDDVDGSDTTVIDVSTAETTER
jgi:cell division protein FtsQ